MFNTVFLENEDENSKTFSRLNVNQHASKVLNYDQKKVFLEKIGDAAGRIGLFFFSDGSYEIKRVNQIYCLEHVPLNTDLLLPKYPKLMDWVVLYYEQTTIITKVSGEKITKIKLNGNGNRIMGLDEPLLCDMAFMSLRLCFMGSIEGWVVC